MVSSDSSINNLRRRAMPMARGPGFALRGGPHFGARIPNPPASDMSPQRTVLDWSGQLDSNQRPAVPKADERSDIAGHNWTRPTVCHCKSLESLIDRQSYRTREDTEVRTASSHDLP